MTGKTDLRDLLCHLTPILREGTYVFCHLPQGRYGDLATLEPLASYQESEGLTLILSQSRADFGGVPYDGLYRCITLNVHSSLDAVGLTAAVSTALAQRGISANMVAAFFHDHIFVQTEKADAAMAVLEGLSTAARNKTP